jgi:hypothetical protein
LKPKKKKKKKKKKIPLEPVTSDSRCESVVMCVIVIDRAGEFRNYVALGEM